MPLRLALTDPGFEAAFAALLGAKRAAEARVDEAVALVLDEVRRDGDAALARLTARFDGPEAAALPLRVPPEELSRAREECDPAALIALALAAARIRAYHERQRPKDERFTDAAGVTLGWRWGAVEAAGLYVPGGTASYPSSVLMTAIPARVAGVDRLAMTVPAPGGRVNPLVLAAAHLAGVDEVFRVGGAQAIGALAHGTATIRSVDVIVGPGNAYVAAAKRMVYGRVGIDMVAGPSEVLVLADATADPAWIAADLLAQAEHDPSSQSILITDDAGLADAAEREVERQLADLPRRAIAAASWRDHGAVIVVPDLPAALPLVDRIAPEHLEIVAADQEALAARVRHAGAIFLGAHTPEAVGDYVGGSNHVLPTGRSARHASGLGVLTFMKRTSILSCSPEALRAIGPAAVALGRAEGLEAHARSVAMRLGTA